MLPPVASLIVKAFCLGIINTALETQGGIHKLFPHSLQGGEKKYKYKVRKNFTKLPPLTFVGYSVFLKGACQKRLKKIF